MRLLDLFCGAGGCAVGYSRAGFTEIVGVDINPQPRYPFAFVQGDALEYLAAHGQEFDAIHASPPCQRYSDLRHRTRGDYPDLIPVVREALTATGRPWVIENVEGAPLKPAVVLCGSHFGLGARGRILRRHRLFEASVPLAGLCCSCSGARIGGVYGTGGRGQMTRGYKFPSRDAKRAMGINWMTLSELSQAIPPAYTEFIGRQLLEWIPTEGE